MKRIWRIMPVLNFRGTTGNQHAEITRNAIDIYEREFNAKSAAEKRAEELARKNPGQKYEVYEIISAYVVDGMTRETPRPERAVRREHAPVRLPQRRVPRHGDAGAGHRSEILDASDDACAFAWDRPRPRAGVSDVPQRSCTMSAPTTLAEVTAQVDDEFARFFRALGFQVDWDFSKRDGLRWYEIIDDGKLLCQVDMHVSLSEFLADLPHFAAGGQRGVGPTNYECRGAHANIIVLYERVKKGAAR
jgi:hypothetical protein